MNVLRLLLVSLLLPISAAAQGIGTVTFLEGPLRVMRGTGVLGGVEGMGLRVGDILESSEKGIVQLEFAGGTIMVLGPSSRAYIFRHAAGRSTAETTSDSPGTQLVLLDGWLKSEGKSGAGAFRFQTPLLVTTGGNASLVIHSYENACDIFVESGSASIAETNSDGSARPPAAAKAGQFFSRRAGKPVASASRPASTFVEAMPPAFRDTLPSRLARFAGKSFEPKAEHQVTYAEIHPWLKMAPAWRKGLVERFEPRLRDSEFRKQLELHVAEYPEWDPILHPEKQHTDAPPAAVPNSPSTHPRL